MKCTIWIIASLCLMSSGLNALGQALLVNSAKHPETDFTEYKSYYWAAQVDRNDDNENYFLDDLVLKADIRDAVREELNQRGYVIDKIAPDLILNFRVFDHRAVLNGSHGYGTKYWSVEEYTPRTERSVEVQAGTIIFSMIDRKLGVLVWEGYVSGFVKDGKFLKNESMVREAVSRIFEEYGITAREYTQR